MLKGTLALAIRYILLFVGTGLATAGIIADTGNGHFCFDTQHVADAAATSVMMIVSGGGTIAASMGWRVLAKRKGGVT